MFTLHNILVAVWGNCWNVFYNKLANKDQDIFFYNDTECEKIQTSIQISFTRENTLSCQLDYTKMF